MCLLQSACLSSFSFVVCMYGCTCVSFVLKAHLSFTKIAVILFRVVVTIIIRNADERNAKAEVRKGDEGQGGGRKRGIGMRNVRVAIFSKTVAQKQKKYVIP